MIKKVQKKYQVNQRKNNAVVQPIFLVELKHSEDNFEKQFIVMGTTGNEYKVKISKKSTCSCWDFKRNCKPAGNFCKHIYFIIKRVLNCSETVFKKKVFTKNDLESIFAQVGNIPQNTLLNALNGSQGSRAASRKIIDIEDTCPICLEELLDGNDLEYCKSVCGKSVHSICIGMWAKKQTMICIYCRGDWKKQKAMTKEEVLKEFENNDKKRENIDKEIKNNLPIITVENVKAEKTEAETETAKLDNSNNIDLDIGRGSINNIGITFNIGGTNLPKFTNFTQTTCSQCNNLKKGPEKVKTAMDFLKEDLIQNILNNNYVNEKWNSLTTIEKNKYLNLEQLDRTRYKEEELELLENDPLGKLPELPSKKKKKIDKLNKKK